MSAVSIFSMVILLDSLVNSPRPCQIAFFFADDFLKKNVIYGDFVLGRSLTVCNIIYFFGVELSSFTGAQGLLLAFLKSLGTQPRAPGAQGLFRWFDDQTHHRSEPWRLVLEIPRSSIEGRKDMEKLMENIGNISSMAILGT